MGELPIVGRCEKCGREFVSLGTNADVDTWPPMPWSGANARIDGSCGGLIRKLDLANLTKAAG